MHLIKSTGVIYPFYVDIWMFSLPAFVKAWQSGKSIGINVWKGRYWLWVQSVDAEICPYPITASRRKAAIHQM